MNIIEHIYFSESSLGRFPVLIYSIIISAYLLLHPARSLQSRLAGFYFIFAALFHFGFFWAHSVYRPIGALGYYLTALSPAGIAVLLQFAYLFPKDHMQKERKAALMISALIAIYACIDYFYSASVSPIKIFSPGYGSTYISKAVPFANAALFLWIIIVFLRKTVYHSRTFHAESGNHFSSIIFPGGKEAVTCRNFALIGTFELLNAGILTSGLLFRSLTFIQLQTVMNFSFFFISSAYVILFLRYLSGSTPISFKIINFGLLGSLVLSVLAGNIQISGSEKNFQMTRNQEIDRILLSFELNEMKTREDIPENLEFIVKFKNGQEPESVYKTANIEIPERLNLWDRTPSLLEFSDSPKYLPSSELSKNSKKLYYTRISEKNIQFYPAVYKNELYGIGFNDLQFRKFIHPHIVSLFSLYLYSLVINLILLPLLLSRNFSQPFRQILAGLYQKTEMLLIPSSGKDLRNELEILNETLIQIKEDIEEKELIQKEFAELKEKVSNAQDSKSKEGSLKDSTVRKVNTVISYLKENFNYELSREGLASMVHLSPGRLGKNFKQITGLKINEYINKLRIEKSAQLLLDTEKTVIEIAYEVGFESLRTFNRVFFSETKMNPGQYRQKKQDNSKHDLD